MSKITRFTFEHNNVRTLGDPISPQFIASDLAVILGYQSTKDATRILDDDEKGVVEIETNGGKQKMTTVTESGMYALVLKSRRPEAKAFRKWVTSEVLPSIRKTGSYTMPSDTIDVTQQYLVRTAVSRLAKNSSLAYQRVYHELYERFKVPRYQELKKADFINVMKFLQASDLLDGMDEPVTPPPQDGGAVLSKEEMKLIQTAVYLRSYLFKPVEEAFYHFLVSAKSPLAPRAWECFHDLNLQLLEHVLDKHGYSVKNMPQYKRLALNR
ncbi:MAG: Bro-N domain-containing protein [Sutterella sp.]